jgi:hypothetical protein
MGMADQRPLKPWLQGYPIVWLLWLRMGMADQRPLKRDCLAALLGLRPWVADGDGRSEAIETLLGRRARGRPVVLRMGMADQRPLKRHHPSRSASPCRSVADGDGRSEAIETGS